MNPRRWSRPAVASLAIFLWAGLLSPEPASAAVCDIAPFSCPASGTCTILGTWSIGSECILDFGPLLVDLKGTLQAENTGGSFTVRAASLTLTGGKLKSIGNTANSGGDLSIQLTGPFTMTGSGPRLDTNGGGGGGTIRVTATSVTLNAGVVTADGGSTAACGSGGVIDLEATTGALVASATVTTSTAGHDCEGGSIFLTGATVTITGDIDARGGASASEDALNAVATAGDLIVTGTAHLRADGTGQTEGSGASGGVVSLQASAGNVYLGGASVTLTGKSPDGSGGALLLAASGNVEATADVLAFAGSAGFGGGLFADAGGNLSVTGDLTATGGAAFPDGEGGTVALRASGELVLASTAVLNLSGAFGGVATVSSVGAATISGQIIARGNLGSGGSVEASACSLTINGTVDVGSGNSGPAGAMNLLGGTVTVGSTGKLLALPCVDASCIFLTSRSGAATIDSHAVVAPSPSTTADPTIPGC